MDELVLVRRARPRSHRGQFIRDGQLVADIQRAAQLDALKEWAQKPSEPFEIVPPLKSADAWTEAGPLYAFGRGVYREIMRLKP